MKAKTKEYNKKRQAREAQRTNTKKKAGGRTQKEMNLDQAPNSKKHSTRYNGGKKKGIQPEGNDDVCKSPETDQRRQEPQEDSTRTEKNYGNSGKSKKREGKWRKTQLPCNKAKRKEDSRERGGGATIKHGEKGPQQLSYKREKQ